MFFELFSQIFGICQELSKEYLLAQILSRGQSSAPVWSREAPKRPLRREVEEAPGRREGRRPGGSFPRELVSGR